jgi:hypothetical protein
MTHTCPPTQINTNNDEGRIQRELCLGITVRKREILHPHNKTWFHTKKHVVIQKHGIFHLHNKYDKKTMEFFDPHSLKHQLLWCASYSTTSRFAVAVPLVVSEAGKQHYFCLRNASVQLTKVDTVNSSCNETLCNRQSPIMQTGSCGCLYSNYTCSIVLDMTVTFKATDSNTRYENQYSVPHF